MTTNGTFNPNEHLISLKGGRPYLPVQWRLVWFREQYPHGSIKTELVHLDLEKSVAIFKAEVSDGEGGFATGHGSETLTDFLDFLEKAESKAIGRALAALGFGTQFAPELDEEHRIVDTPTIAPQRPTAAPENGTSNNTPAAVHPTPESSQSDAAELKAIMQELKALGLVATKADWQAWRYAALGVELPVNELTHDHIVLLRHAVEDFKMQGVPASPAA